MTSYTIIKDEKFLHLAQKVVNAFPELAHVDLDDVQFAFRESEKCKYHGRTQLVRGVDKIFTDKDIVIVIWLNSWIKHKMSWRALLLYHELRHIVHNDKGEYALVRHDVEDFSDMIEKYGVRWEQSDKILKRLK